jgi:hypothetical protein
MEGIPLCFIILQINSTDLFRQNTTYTIISTLVWLHVPVPFWTIIEYIGTVNLYFQMTTCMEYSRAWFLYNYQYTNIQHLKTSLFLLQNKKKTTIYTNRFIATQNIPLCFNFQNKINWFIPSKHIIYNHQHPRVATCFVPFPDHRQANIYLYKALSVCTVNYGMPYCIQDVRINNYKSLWS